MKEFQGNGIVGTETASAFYACNSKMLGDPLHIEWDGDITIPFRDDLKQEHPDDNIVASGPWATMRAFKDYFQYFPGINDTDPMEIRASYTIAQAGETGYGPLGPGPINAADLHKDYKSCFALGASFDAKREFLKKWFAPAEQMQQPMTDAQAVAALNKAGYSA